MQILWGQETMAAVFPSAVLGLKNVRLSLTARKEQSTRHHPGIRFRERDYLLK